MADTIVYGCPKCGNESSKYCSNKYYLHCVSCGIEWNLVTRETVTEASKRFAALLIKALGATRTERMQGKVPNLANIPQQGVPEDFERIFQENAKNLLA